MTLQSRSRSFINGFITVNEIDTQAPPCKRHCIGAKRVDEFSPLHRSNRVFSQYGHSLIQQRSKSKYQSYLSFRNLMGINRNPKDEPLPMGCFQTPDSIPMGFRAMQQLKTSQIPLSHRLIAEYDIKFQGVNIRSPKSSPIIHQHPISIRLSRSLIEFKIYLLCEAKLRRKYLKQCRRKEGRKQRLAIKTDEYGA